MTCHQDRSTRCPIRRTCSLARATIRCPLAPTSPKTARVYSTSVTISLVSVNWLLCICYLDSSISSVQQLRTLIFRSADNIHKSVWNLDLNFHLRMKPYLCACYTKIFSVMMPWNLQRWKITLKGFILIK